MIKEPKAQRAYFRVPQSFKDEFIAAAITNSQDPSEAFRLIGRQFIDKIKQEKSEDFLTNLEKIRTEAAAASATPTQPTTQKAKLTSTTARPQKASSKKQRSGRSRQ